MQNFMGYQMLQMILGHSEALTTILAILWLKMAFSEGHFSMGVKNRNFYEIACGFLHWINWNYLFVDQSKVQLLSA